MLVPDLSYDIRCWNTPLINENFISFDVQQILRLPIYFSQLQDEFAWGVSRSAICSMKS
jgi:hypothetical protein